MKMLRSQIAMGCLGGVGLWLLAACSGDAPSTESSTAASEGVQRGSHGRRNRGNHGRSPGHHHVRNGHGAACGHDHGHGGSSGAGAGSGASAGTSSGGSTATGGAASGGFPTTGGTDGGGAGGSTGGGFTGGSGGAPEPGICGDGELSFDEQCDDANLVTGDGCDADCVLETGFVCPEPGTPCREVVCGDGFQDGYFVPGDGQTGGTGGSSGGTGDGGVATGGSAGSTGGSFVFEACDDGNTTNGDGCSAACFVEDGFICDVPGEPCRQPRCGDGFVDFIPGTGGTGGTGTGGSPTGGTAGSGGSGSFEQCDDGNETPDDGCDASCVIESGFACPEPGTPCHPIVCGDSIADWPEEECDDGNETPDDGCTDCTLDSGSGTGGSAGVGGNAGAPSTGGVGAG